MPPRSRSHKLLFAVGAISSIAAITASYLYYTSSLGEVPTKQRRKVIVSSSSVDELLDLLPLDSIDEIYVTLLHTSEDSDFDDKVKQLELRCAYLLHHQKGQGLTHIVRHVAPSLVVIAPSMVRETKLEEIKDWVDGVAVSAAGTDSGNIKYIGSSTGIYQRALMCI